MVKTIKEINRGEIIEIMKKVIEEITGIIKSNAKTKETIGTNKKSNTIKRITRSSE